ncbi:B3 domain-containing protein Os12g0592300-like [Curcuma longa]|uniref:B3 domain-containing protein Os12g0592300-like n=1 Tax=Curcuma longa TaxID=136217 RepID=UPI003D9F70B8
MSGRCKGCEEWEKHFYWNHMDKRRIHFFKIMAGDFTKRLKLPKNFVKNFKDHISGDVTLKGPSGNSWRVGSTNMETELCFRAGWKNFVEDHHIKEFDILVFRYDGDSCFDVLIFGGDGCEKVTCFLDQKRNLKRREKADDDSAQSLRASPHGKTIADISSSSSSYEGEKDHVKEEEVEKEMQVGITTPPSLFVSRKTKLSLTELKKASKLSLRIPKENPTFAVVMRQSNVSESPLLTIPASFRNAYLRKDISQFTLQIPTRAKRWIVKVAKTRKSIGGVTWKRFVVDNNLKEGDVCVFELAEGEGAKMMMVHIAKCAT